MTDTTPETTYTAPDGQEFIVTTETAPEGVKPLTDDAYWFEKFKTQLDSVDTVYTTAATNLNSLADWGLGLYFSATAITGVGFSLFSANDLPSQSALWIGIGAAAMVFIKWMALWVNQPIMEMTDDRSAEEIRKDFSHQNRVRQLRINTGYALSMIAAALVAYSIVVAATAQPVEEPPAPIVNPFEAGDFTAEVRYTPEGVGYIHLIAEFPDTDTVTICVTPITGENTNAVITSCADEARVSYPLIEGRLQTSVAFPAEVFAAAVEIGWTDDEGTIRRIIRTVSTGGA